MWIKSTTKLSIQNIGNIIIQSLQYLLFALCKKEPMLEKVDYGSNNGALWDRTQKSPGLENNVLAVVPLFTTVVFSRTGIIMLYDRQLQEGSAIPNSEHELRLHYNANYSQRWSARFPRSVASIRLSLHIYDLLIMLHL